MHDDFSLTEARAAIARLVAESNGGYANIGNRDGYNWVWENTANYTKTWGDHTFTALVGMTAQAFVSEMSKNGMPQNVVTYRSNDSI